MSDIFKEVNDFVFDPKVGFEQLQNKCLELAGEVERLKGEIYEREQVISHLTEK